MGKRIANRLKTWLLAVSGWIVLSTAAMAACNQNLVELRGDFGTLSIKVVVADTFETRQRGLMFVSSMADDTGMLFVYDMTQIANFWMKNTLIPLDMVFINGRGVVHKVHENAIPHDLTPISSNGPVRSVLEINGGLARKLGIKPGVQVRHPGLPQRRAAWKC